MLLASSVRAHARNESLPCIILLDLASGGAPSALLCLPSHGEWSDACSFACVATRDGTTVNARLAHTAETEPVGRGARIKAVLRWASLGVALVAGGAGYKFNRDAQRAYDESDAAYAQYRQATTTEEAVRWRQEAQDASDRADRAAMKRNILYGAAGAGLCLGIVFSF